MADGQARAGSREAAVGDQGARAGQPHRLDQARGHEHLLHAGSSARTFIAHDHDVTGLDRASLDRRRGVVLALEHARAAAEGEESGINPGRLDDATLAGQVAAEDGEPTVPAVRVWHVADAALSAIEVEGV